MSCINVCIACDDNYSKYAGVVIASVLYNSLPDETLNFYILDGGISELRKKEILSLKSIKNCNINFVVVNPNDFKEYQKVCTHKYITLPAYYRLKLATLLPDVDKIIYFDCDTIINSSLADLFNTDINNYALVGVKDINPRIVKKNPKYFNSGVLLFNLDYWRKNHIEDKLLQFTKVNFDNIKMGDQEVLNCVLNDEVKIVDDTWNVQTSDFMNRSSFIHKPNIIHYITKNKPWKNVSLCYFKGFYIKYLQLTPWKKTPLQLFKYTYIEQFLSLCNFVISRPLFFLQGKFYKALFKTYILND